MIFFAAFTKSFLSPNVYASEAARYVPAGKNYGVGIKTPSAQLEVNGQIMITGGSPSNGYALTTNGSGLASWEAIPALTPATPYTSLQYLNGTTLEGSSDLVFNSGTNTLTVNGTVAADAFTGDGSGVTGIASASCNASNTGLLKYNTSTNKRMYCNGTSWTNVTVASANKVLVSTGEWYVNCTTILPPTGASTSTHNIYYYWGHRDQTNWEQEYQYRGAGIMGSDAGVSACGAGITPQFGTYVAIAIPKSY